MNMIMLLILALVLCAYFWSDCPKMLKDNKQMLLGVVVGLVLCKYFKVYLVEGYYLYPGCQQRQRSRMGDTSSAMHRMDDRPCDEVGLGDDDMCFDTHTDCRGHQHMLESAATADQYETVIDQSTGLPHDIPKTHKSGGIHKSKK